MHEYLDLSPIEQCIRNLARQGSMAFVFATTTGQGVALYLDLAKKYGVKPVAVVPHKIGNPRWKPFDSSARKAIEEAKGEVVFEKAHWALRRVAGLLVKHRLENFLGVGGRVCGQAIEIALNQGAIKSGQTVIAMAGKNSVFAFEIISAKPVNISFREIIINKT